MNMNNKIEEKEFVLLIGTVIYILNERGKILKQDSKLKELQDKAILSMATLCTDDVLMDSLNFKKEDLEMLSNDLQPFINEFPLWVKNHIKQNQEHANNACSFYVED